MTSHQAWSSKSINQVAPADRAVHNWYRFVLSFPPHLVREYLERFKLSPDQTVLDPFAGTGTTLVECQKQGIPSVGVEANPLAHFACSTKLNWQPDPLALSAHVESILSAVAADLQWFTGNGLRRTLPEMSEKLLPKNAISPKPLHKTLVLLEGIELCKDDRYRHHEQLALMKAVIFSASNLRFAPEVYVARCREDANVAGLWQDSIANMVADLTEFPRQVKYPARIHIGDARCISQVVEPHSIDAVITSPPYPNEKDYTRNTRLESVLLGFLKDKTDLRAVKSKLLRSNSRNIYSQDQDDQWISAYPNILSIADAIDHRRQELGKTSGFSRLYSRVVKLYFGGMAKHLADLRQLLRPGAQLAYVVGDQASFLGIFIPTGQLLAEIALNLGYEYINLDLFRTRRVASKNLALREEVLILRWPG